MKIKRGLVARVLRILLHNVGDTRVCPKCHHHFIPNDATSSESFNLHKELSAIKGKKK